MKDLSQEEQQGKILEYIGEAQTGLNIEEGPLLRAVLFNCGESGKQLFVVIHHLIVDGVSWRIILEDLNQGYEQLRKGKPIEFSRQTTSYQQWSKQLSEYAQSEELREELSYWDEALPQEVSPLPIDMAEGENRVASSEEVSVELNQEETRQLIQKVPKAYRTQINDVLVTALLQAIGDWTGDYGISFNLEGHGREVIGGDIDLSRTVGWFTSVYPVYIHLEEADDLGKSLKQVKEALRTIPNKGIGYGILRYLTEEGKKSLGERAEPEIVFNYLGQWESGSSNDHSFQFSEGPTGRSEEGETETSETAVRY